MPLNAVGWSSEEEEKLVELVQPHSYLYNLLDPSRKNILARESTWQEIAQELFKPVEECKKRWRGLRDGYMRSKRMGTMHKTKATMFEKLQFLDTSLDGVEEVMDEGAKETGLQHEIIVPDQQEVITDNQEYYEITVLENPEQDPQGTTKPYIKIVPKNMKMQSILPEPPKRGGTGGARKNAGRKKSLPMPRNVPPIKILPKPVITMSDPGIMRYIEDPKIIPAGEQRSQVIDKLIEKVLKENTNEIDVFFRSMAASVKKLQPILIPKVKMEVCNVIAKYEMLSFDKSL